MGATDKGIHCEPHCLHAIPPIKQPARRPLPWFVDEVSALEIFSIGDVAGHGLLAPGMEIQVISQADCRCSMVMAGFQAKGTLVPRHWHRQAQQFICASGLLVIEQDSRPVVLKDGMAIVIPPRTPHSVYSSEDSHFYMSFWPSIPILWKQMPREWRMDGTG